MLVGVEVKSRTFWTKYLYSDKRVGLLLVLNSPKRENILAECPIIFLKRFLKEMVFTFYLLLPVGIVVGVERVFSWKGRERILWMK